MMKRLSYIVCFFIISLIFFAMLGEGCKNTMPVAQVNGIVINSTNDFPAIILDVLINQFAQEKGVMATPQEINEVGEFKAKRIKEACNEQIVRLVNELNGLRVANDNTTDSSNKIEKIQQDIDQWMRIDPYSYFETPNGILFVEKEVFMWKLHQTLYDTYGGDVYFSHLGPVPIGAYTAFLQEKELNQSFIIFDEKLKKYFWDVHTNYTQKTHFKFDEEDAKKAFEIPPWEFK